MEPTDKPKFAQALIGMGEVYDRTISPAAAGIYFDDLKDYPLADVLAAFSAHRKDPDRGRFFPKVADLIAKLDVTDEQAALVAWADLLPLLLDSRNAQSPDPITERVVQDLGGWTRIGHTPTDKLVWIEKEFVKRYAVYAQHGDKPLLLGPRKGLKLVGKDL